MTTETIESLLARITITRGLAERTDSRRTKTYEILVRWLVSLDPTTYKGVDLDTVNSAFGLHARAALGAWYSSSHGSYAGQFVVRALAKYARPSEMPADPWPTFADANPESELPKALALAVLTGIREREERDARETAGRLAHSIWSHACKSVDGAFAEEIAAVMRRREDARNAKFRELQTQVRENPKAHINDEIVPRAIELATSPSVTLTHHDACLSLDTEILLPA